MILTAFDNGIAFFCSFAALMMVDYLYTFEIVGGSSRRKSENRRTAAGLQGSQSSSDNDLSEHSGDYP